MRLRSLRTAWKRATWLTRLSGLTSAPSTLDAGAERWIASLRAFPVSRIPSPEAEKALMTRAGFGPTSPGSCLIAVRGSSCWKTSQDSLLPVDSDQSSVTWPKWGSMRNGAAYLRPAWAPATNASACSSWPTPDCNTATYSNGKRGQNIREAVANWPTPQAMDAGKASPSVHQDNLTMASRNWPTPTARDYREGYDMRQRTAGPTLTNAAQDFSPPAPTIPAGPTSLELRPGARPQFVQEVSASDGMTRPNLSSRSRLNPAFVNWLMGLPWWWTNIAHTNSDSAVTASYRSKLQQQLRCCLGASGSARSKAA